MTKEELKFIIRLRRIVNHIKTIQRIDPLLYTQWINNYLPNYNLSRITLYSNYKNLNYSIVGRGIENCYATCVVVDDIYGYTSIFSFTSDGLLCQENKKFKTNIDLNERTSFTVKRLLYPLIKLNILTENFNFSESIWNVS